MINTYNESKLHLTLKKLYAMEYNGICEVKLDDTEWICDIIDENGDAIEIQTSNLSALTEKVEYLLETGRKVKIVHPVFEEKYIEMVDLQGELLYRKKSPKKATVYDSLRGMTKICTFFLNKDCTLEVLSVRITEVRRETETPSQNTAKSRHHLKSWVIQEKRLEEIKEKKVFRKEEFIKLLCLESDSEKEEFRLCDIQKTIKKKHGVKAARWASLVIWILLKMKLIEIKKIKGRSKFYGLRNETYLNKMTKSTAVFKEILNPPHRTFFY